MGLYSVHLSIFPSRLIASKVRHCKKESELIQYWLWNSDGKHQGIELRDGSKEDGKYQHQAQLRLIYHPE